MAIAQPPASADQPPAVSQGGNGWAIASFVCGLVGLVLLFVRVIGATVGLLGIIFGVIGIARSKKVGGRGKARAIVGIVCGAIGLVVAIAYSVYAVSVLKGYLNRSKALESELNLTKIEMLIMDHYGEAPKLPPSSSLSLPDVDGGACAAGGRMAAKPQSVWASDPAWRAINFYIDEPAWYSYHWTKVSDTEGYITSVGDLDCNGTLSTTRVDIHIVNGNITADHHAPTPE